MQDSTPRLADFGKIEEPGPPPGDVESWFETVPMPSSRPPTLLMPVEQRLGEFIGDPFADGWFKS
jgi:hypothetical protein